MRTMTIRDLRHKWPEAEAALQLEDEIIITRDSKPVAKLIPFTEPAPKRKRWDPKAHARWQKKVAGGKITQSNEALQLIRADRVLISPKKKS
jgi:antitoxin (DNA-binding transcriptional repressor) of toxin-antitoxin stability system